ncbi:MAG: type III secretion system chaperone, partial [Ramlibacter sp.]
AATQHGAQPHDQDFRNLWAQYAHAQGLAATSPASADDSGYILTVEGLGHVFVRPEAASGRVLLKTVLTFLPLDNEDPNWVFRGLLQAHLLGEATEGAVFAIDRDEGDLIACRRLPMDGLDSFALNEAIDSIAGTAQHMCGLLALEAPTP